MSDEMIGRTPEWREALSNLISIRTAEQGVIIEEAIKAISNYYAVMPAPEFQEQLDRIERKLDAILGSDVR